MAVTTVSSLAESFVSGVPVASKDTSVDKEKSISEGYLNGAVPHDANGADEAVGQQLESASIDMKEVRAEESDESDFELQVHD